MKDMLPSFAKASAGPSLSLYSKYINIAKAAVPAVAPSEARSEGRRREDSNP